MRALLSTTRRQSQPAIAVLVAWLCLLLQASGVAHGLLVRHSFCLEHGELIHVPEAGKGSAPPAFTSRGKAFAVQATGSAEADEHEHCAVFAHRRDSLATSPQAHAVAASPHAERAEATHAGGLLRAPACALLLLAPKTSPPV